MLTEYGPLQCLERFMPTTLKKVGGAYCLACLYVRSFVRACLTLFKPPLAFEQCLLVS